MVTLGIDYAARHSQEQLQCLKAQGIAFIVRYLTIPSLSWKRLTREEAEEIAAEGLGIVSVYQARQNRIEDFSRENARQDADAALVNAKEVGQQTGTPIYFAVDFDVQEEHLPTLIAYFDTVIGVFLRDGHYSVGIYGSHRAIEQPAMVKGLHAWQTYAWSGGKVSPLVDMLQFKNGANLCDGSNDLDLAWGDPGWWPRPQSLTFPEMPTLRRGNNSWQVAALQSLIVRHGINVGPIDGAFGPKTERGVQEIQRREAREPSGIADTSVWAALAPPTEPDRQTEIARLTKERDEARDKLARIAAILNG